MDRSELVRKLNSVGKKAFVEHYELFEDYAHGSESRDHVIEELVRLGKSNDAGAAIRTGNAKLIFEAQQELAALGLIVESKRLPQATKDAAARLLRERSVPYRQG